jgi:hypothetical protein
MADLTRDHVGALIGALGVPTTEEDLAEITHRLNGFLDALGELAALPLDSVEPWPTLPEPARDTP